MTSCEPNTIIEIEIGISGLLLIWLASIVAEASRAASTIYAPQRPSMRDRIARRTGALFSCGRKCLREAKADEGSFSEKPLTRPLLQGREESPTPRCCLPGGWLRTGTRYGARSRR